MGRIRIVIADDHPVVRAGLHEMLRSQPDFEIVGEASNGVEAVSLVNQVQPDVVLMDLRMTLLDGAAATGPTLGRGKWGKSRCDDHRAGHFPAPGD